MNDRQIACFLEAVKERNFTKIVSDTAGGQQNDRYAGEGIKYKAVCAFRT